MNYAKIFIALCCANFAAASERPADLLAVSAHRAATIREILSAQKRNIPLTPDQTEVARYCESQGALSFEKDVRPLVTSELFLFQELRRTAETLSPEESERFEQLALNLNSRLDQGAEERRQRAEESRARKVVSDIELQKAIRQRGGLRWANQKKKSDFAEKKHQLS